MCDSFGELLLSDAHATEMLGAALARTYLAGGAPDVSGVGRDGAVVFLHGELGAGKTTCVRSLLRALGVNGLIRSPTYTLVEVYEPGDTLCVHVDLYRLSGPIEIEELGLRDYLDGNCLLLVEWPEKGAGVIPTADLELTLNYRGSGRHARVAAGSGRGRRWLEMLSKDSSLDPYVSNST